MNKPVVLVIAPTPYFSERGCHIRIFEELKLIAQLGYAAELVTYPLGRDLGDAHITRTTRLPWYHKTSAGPAWSKLILDLFLLRTAWKVTKQQHPILIHAHLHESMWIAWLLKKRFHIPVVLDLQSALAAELKSYGSIWKWFAPLAHLYERWAIRHADQVVASTTKVSTQATVLPDGVSSATVPTVTKQYDLVYSGGMGKAKGTDVLGEALAMVAKERPIKSLIITKAKPTFLTETITWLEHVPYEELLPTLAQAKVGIEPKPIQSTEGSAKLLNYLAAGLLVATLPSNNPTAEGLARNILAALDGKSQQRTLTKWQDNLPILKQVYERALR